jgi:hypothetical protein
LQLAKVEYLMEPVIGLLEIWALSTARYYVPDVLAHSPTKIGHLIPHRRALLKRADVSLIEGVF